MIRTLLVVLLISSTACSTVGERPEPIDVSARLAALEEVDFPDPIPLPTDKGRYADGVIDGEPVAYLTAEEHAKRMAYITALKANSDIAGQAGPTIRALAKEDRAKLEVVRDLEARANWAVDREYECRVEKYAEKKDHIIESLINRALIIGAIIFGLR